MCCCSHDCIVCLLVCSDGYYTDSDSSTFLSVGDVDDATRAALDTENQDQTILERYIFARQAELDRLQAQRRDMIERKKEILRERRHEQRQAAALKTRAEAEDRRWRKNAPRWDAGYYWAYAVNNPLRAKYERQAAILKAKAAEVHDLTFQLHRLKTDLAALMSEGRAEQWPRDAFPMFKEIDIQTGDVEDTSSTLFQDDIDEPQNQGKKVQFGDPTVTGMPHQQPQNQGAFALFGDPTVTGAPQSATSVQPQGKTAACCMCVCVCVCVCVCMLFFSCD